MGRYKALIFAGQQTETAIGVAALNRTLAAGRPTSVRSQAIIRSSAPTPINGLLPANAAQGWEG